jgi:hypothetical protein
MPYQELAEELKIGTAVRITLSGFFRARIVDSLGRLGPKGARVYRVLVSKRPKMYTEVLEEQLEVLEDQESPAPPS